VLILESRVAFVPIGRGDNFHQRHARHAAGGGARAQVPGRGVDAHGQTDRQTDRQTDTQPDPSGARSRDINFVL
jgi:hypothetical protein